MAKSSLLKRLCRENRGLKLQPPSELSSIDNNNVIIITKLK